jgi:hypothetical protein
VEIVEFVIPAADNPYKDDVAKLVEKLNEREAYNEANDIVDDNVTLSAVFYWPTDEFNKERVLLSKAANLAGKTARLRVKEETTDDEGNKVTKATFTLSHKHKQRRNKEKEAAKKNEEGDDNAAAPFTDAPDNDTPDAPSNDAAEAENVADDTAATDSESTTVRRRRK